MVLTALTNRARQHSAQDSNRNALVAEPLWPKDSSRMRRALGLDPMTVCGTFRTLARPVDFPLPGESGSDVPPCL